MNMSKTIVRRFIYLFYIRLPLILFYYMNLYFPILFINILWSYILSTTALLCRRSIHMRKVVVASKTLVTAVRHSIKKVTHMKISQIILLAWKCSIDIFRLLMNRQLVDHENSALAIGEMSDLVFYEETDANPAWEPVTKRMRRIMHHYVPPNTFRATVRVRSSQGTSSEIASTYHTGYTIDGDVLEPDSPLSFPVTPFSRARVMNRSTERVSSVMFIARDRLRLDTLSASHDDISRQTAIDTRNRGKFAAFDPNQASEGLALTCGNHCAFKVGKSLCCSCKAMIPIRRDVYTYFEFSITSSHEKVPMVSVGISPQECPLNVMVGSWNSSLGLYTDGQLLAESKWYQSSKYQLNVDAGITVGVLVYIPSQNNQTSHQTAATSASNGLMARVQYNINGYATDYDIPTAILNKLQECSSDIYPTISVLSEGTRVWCRFCEADIVYRSRRSIKAPPFVNVYCLDGSKLLSDVDF